MSAEEEPAERSGAWGRVFPIMTVILLPLAVAHGVLFPVLHHGHSAHIDLIRQIEMDQAFRDGNLYPRWTADFYFGRGSPIFNFYAPLVYLIGQFFCLVGLTPLYAVKAVYILFVLLAGCSMYLLAREVWGRRIAVACASLYVLSPYLLVDLYVRSALAELSGFAFLPLAMYFLLRLARSTEPGGGTDFAPAACAVALLCLSHNITALIGLPLLVGWVLVTKDRAPYRRMFYALALGLVISSFFWMPALFEKRWLNADASLIEGDYSYANYFLTLAGLVRPDWGFGSPMSKGPNGMSTQIGVVHLLIAAPALLWLLMRRRWSPRRRAAAGFLGIAAISVFCTTALSKPLWDRVPLMPYVQFPFRFLLPATLGLTAFAGAAAWLFGKRGGERSRNTVSYVMILMAVVAYAPYVQARYLLHDRRDKNRVLSVTRNEAQVLLRDPNIIEAEDLLTPWVLREVRESRSTAKDDYLPIWVREKPKSYFTERVEATSGEASIEPLTLGQIRYHLQINAATTATILVHTFYFPGWRARVGESELVIKPHETTGEIVFRVPPGLHDVVVEFADTRVRLLAKVLSLLGVVALIGGMGGGPYRKINGVPAATSRPRLRDRVSSRIRRRIDRRLRRRPLR